MLSLRDATVEDALVLFSWRNDPTTRLASHHTGEIVFDNHLAWLEATLANPMKRLLIAEENGLPVGVVRADHEASNIVQLSWTVGPNARGRGIANRIVKMACDAYLASGIRCIRAEIKTGNHASVRVAEAAGMQLSHQDGAVLNYCIHAPTQER